MTEKESQVFLYFCLIKIAQNSDFLKKMCFLYCRGSLSLLCTKITVITNEGLIKLQITGPRISDSCRSDVGLKT